MIIWLSDYGTVNQRSLFSSLISSADFIFKGNKFITYFIIRGFDLFKILYFQNDL